MPRVPRRMKNKLDKEGDVFFMIQPDEKHFDTNKPYLCEPLSPWESKPKSSQVGLICFKPSVNPAELNGYTRKSISDHKVPALCFDNFLTTGDLDERSILRIQAEPSTKTLFSLNAIQGDKESWILN